MTLTKLVAEDLNFGYELRVAVSKILRNSLSLSENHEGTVRTDRPHGSLMFRTEVSKAGCHRIECPKKFGRLYLRRVGNLVGLDEQLTIDGNDKVKINTFNLSPKITKYLKQANKVQGKTAKSSTNWTMWSKVYVI